MKQFLIILTTFFYFFSESINAQTDFYLSLPNSNTTSVNSRAPQGSMTNARTHWLITPSEMAASGFVNGDVINAIGFNYNKSIDSKKIQNIATTSTTFNVYMENTTDVANNKSANWNTAVSTMTLVGTNNITLPEAVSGPLYHKFSGGNKFTYTGGGLYIAFDYANTGTIAITGNDAYCNTNLVDGLKSQQSKNRSAPTTVGTSSYRPQTYLGLAVDCERPFSQKFLKINNNSVVLSWTGSGTDYIIEYGEDDFELGTGIIENVNGASSISISNLKQSTVYQFYVKNNCGSSTSINRGPLPFYTQFEPTNIDYATSFETYDFPYIGWNADVAANGTNWYIAYPPYASMVSDGYQSIGSYTSPVDNTNARLFSRGINLEADKEVEISFDVRKYATNDATGTVDFQLSVGSDQTELAQTEILISETDLQSTTFERKSALYKPLSSGVYYFSFLNNSPIEPTPDQFSLVIVDNFSVKQKVLQNSNFVNSLFSIIPNPANNFVNISGNNVNFNSIKITDLNGRIVKDVTFEGVSSTQLAISDLSAGVYIMNIYSIEGVATKKLIKN